MSAPPKRIVVSEVRGPEAHVMLKARNTGHPRSVATVHANDAISGLLNRVATITGPVTLVDLAKLR